MSAGSPTLQLLGPEGPLARAFASYEDRPAQLEMAEAVERTLSRNGVLMVEAGTGTGKSLAYLVPALLSGRKVVVSTGTRNLQDQIMERDLPLIRDALGLQVDAACMKGLSNYLCLRRMEDFVRSPESLRRNAGASKNSEGDLDRLLAWRHDTVSGDRAELDWLSEDAALWAQVSSSSDTRIGPRCQHYEKCFSTKMRRRAEDAQLVVVNHHLYFADLATRSGQHGGHVLPEHDVVIFDEAHAIEDVATAFFGVRVSTARIEAFVRDAGAAFAANDVREAESLLSRVTGASTQFFVSFPAQAGQGSGRVPLDAGIFSGDLEAKLHRLDGALEELSSVSRRLVGKSESLAQVARRAQRLRDDLAEVTGNESGPRVRWVERRGRMAAIGASPVDVGERLREEIFYRVDATVLTSATLSTGGSFGFVRKRLGIDATEVEAEEITLPPAFDYPRQAALYMPSEIPDPRDASFHARAAEEVLGLVAITGGGAFVLCTSYRSMQALAKLCGPKLKLPIFIQGQAPKHALLQRFRAAENGVLFATASFWEGVDVPGDALRLVVIDKLPFDVPSDPVVNARCERIRESGGSPFMEYLVPSAALSLKQGFGRLIRRRSDRGVVAVLDKRLRSKGYGKHFLRSLPELPHLGSLAEVQSFWADLHPQVD